MSKISMTTSSTNRTSRRRSDAISLSPTELQALYLFQEVHVRDIVEIAATLDETQRSLALRLLKAMADHRRSQLS